MELTTDNQWLLFNGDLLLFDEEMDESFLPCDYVRHYEDGKDAELPQHAA